MLWWKKGHFPASEEAGGRTRRVKRCSQGVGGELSQGVGGELSQGVGGDVLRVRMSGWDWMQGSHQDWQPGSRSG